VGLGRLLLVDDLSSGEVILHHDLIIKLLALLCSDWDPRRLLIESDLDPSRDDLLDGDGRSITYRCVMLNVSVLHNFMTQMVRHGIHCAGAIGNWGSLVL
jgi:hypothetical protein